MAGRLCCLFYSTMEGCQPEPAMLYKSSLHVVQNAPSQAERAKHSALPHADVAGLQ